MKRGRCVAHLAAQRTERRADPARSDAVYTTRTWRTLRLQVIAEEPQCYRCGAPSTEADHIVPRSKGGPDARGNLRGACKRCNSSRGARG